MKLESFFVFFTLACGVVIKASPQESTMEEAQVPFPEQKVDPKFLNPSSAIVGEEGRIQKRADSAENWECLNGQNYLRMRGRAEWELAGSYFHSGKRNVTTWENTWISIWAFSRTEIQSYASGVAETKSFELSSSTEASFKLVNAGRSSSYSIAETMMNEVLSAESTSETVLRKHEVKLGPYAFGPFDAGHMYRTVFKFPGGLKIDGASFTYFTDDGSPDSDPFIEEVSMLFPVKMPLGPGCINVSKKFRLRNKETKVCLEPKNAFNIISTSTCNGEENQIFQFYQSEESRKENIGLLMHVQTGRCIFRSDVTTGLIKLSDSLDGTAAFLTECRLDDPEQYFQFAEDFGQERRLIWHANTNSVFTNPGNNQILFFSRDRNNQPNQQWIREYVS